MYVTKVKAFEIGKEWHICEIIKWLSVENYSIFQSVLNHDINFPAVYFSIAEVWGICSLNHCQVLLFQLWDSTKLVSEHFTWKVIVVNCSIPAEKCFPKLYYIYLLWENSFSREDEHTDLTFLKSVHIAWYLASFV